MQYITVTELRTKTPQLVKALKSGHTVKLIHRSQVVGDIRPSPKVFKPLDVTALKSAIKALNLPHLTPEQRAENYRRHFEEKYVKCLS